MENKINIAKLLKDCPKGMELDCAMYNKVTLSYVDNERDIYYPIRVKLKDGNVIGFTKYGQYLNADFAKCVIFPKGKTTWEGFHRPFKDGDIVATGNGLFIGIVEVKNNIQVKAYCAISPSGSLSINIAYRFERFATEEEKQKLFDAIKAHGYKWNAETKTLEDLIEPKFKVGDKVKSKNCPKAGNFVIVDVEEDRYSINIKNYYIEFKDQDNYELVPNKFDITTLKPFDMVLTRIKKGDVWGNDFFGYYKDGWFHCSGHIAVLQCIPYEGNEHLLGTTDDCDDFFKTWK